MGRPEPCVLFAQTFVHSQLDEYVDEVCSFSPTSTVGVTCSAYWFFPVGVLILQHVT